MSQPVFAIPVRPHVRQFLVKELGIDPLPINQRSWLGRLLPLLVEKVPYRLERRMVPDRTRESYQITLPTALKHYTIKPEKLAFLGEFLRKHFQEQLVLFIKGQIVVSGNERAALRSFYELYNINPDDYDIEEARKVYRDYRDRVLKHNQQHALMVSGEANFTALAAAA